MAELKKCAKEFSRILSIPIYIACNCINALLKEINNIKRIIFAGVRG